VIRYLKFFTFHPRPEIEALEQQHQQRPEARAAHKALAKAVTDLVHGESATAEAMRASEILFGGGLEGISESLFEDIVHEAPCRTAEESKLEGAGWPLVDVLVHSGLSSSKGQARKDIEGGGIYLNNGREASGQRMIIRNDLLFGKYLLLRKGKRESFMIVSDENEKRSSRQS
jgi:tyrosyl-tRNA synthetase